MIDKVVLLTQRREKYLVVAAVRFIRTVLSRHVSVNVYLFFEYNNCGEGDRNFDLKGGRACQL